MYSKRTIIINETGLHARPASDFIQEAKKYVSKVTIANLDTPEEAPVNAKSIVMVLSLGMGQGTHVEVSASGEDEQLAVNNLISLIDSGFGE